MNRKNLLLVTALLLAAVAASWVTLKNVRQTCPCHSVSAPASLTVTPAAERPETLQELDDDWDQYQRNGTGRMADTMKAADAYWDQLNKEYAEIDKRRAARRKLHPATAKP